jgi:5S rRNA maturation endonuclease (ribonuclease M5)
MDKRAEIDKILGHLKRLKERCTLVIVEGKKDKAILENFGITRILEMEAYYTLIDKIDKINEKEVAVLVDLDSEGKKIYGKLKEILTRHGVRVDDSFRHFLFKTRLRQIEGLDSYIKL